MHLRGRVRLHLLILLAVMAAVAAVISPVPSPPPAAAFKLGPHEQLVRSALSPFGIPPDRMDIIVGNILTGYGNLGSDQHQFDEYRHFDNAPDRGTVCKRATDAWTRFYSEIRYNVHPTNPPEWNGVDNGVINALSSFGMLTHSLQDFYAHSNWAELHIQQGQSPGPAPGLFPPPCDPSSWPAGLQTGYFNLRNGVDGCPGTVPPAPFAFCHEALNKDNDASKEGGKQVPGLPPGTTYHQLAMQVARVHTTQLYQQVVEQLKHDWAQDYPQVRPDCLVAHVFQDSHQSCRYGRLSVVKDDAVPLGVGNLELVSPEGQTLTTYPVSFSIQTSACLSGLTLRYDIAVQDKYTPPTPRRYQGQTTLSGSGCDASVHLSPRSQLRYLIRFVNADTVPYFNVTAWVNGAPWQNLGPVPAGGALWFDLGPCPNVANFDFGWQFNDPDTGALRTVTPIPPFFDADPTCVDSANVKR